MPEQKKTPDTPDTRPGPTAPTEGTPSVPAWKPGDKVERPATLMGRMSYVSAEMTRVPKRGHNKFHGYTYATEGDIMGALTPLLAKWGVFLQVHPQLAELTVRELQRREGKAPEMLYALPVLVKWVNADDTADAFEATWLAQAIDNSDKGINKAYTAAMKYAVLKQFLISTGDDPEGDDEMDRRVLGTPALPPQQAAQQHQQMVDKVSKPRAVAPEGPEPEWLQAGVAAVVDTGKKTSSGTTITEVRFDLGAGLGTRTAALFGTGTRLVFCQDAQRHGTLVEVKLRAKEFRGKVEYQVEDVRELVGAPAETRPAPKAVAPDAHLFEGGDDDSSIPF